jgi:hypothetical protein
MYLWGVCIIWRTLVGVIDSGYIAVTAHVKYNRWGLWVIMQS